MDFIHFGCWNNIEGNVINVINFLKKYIQKNKIDFINIAGDNYYPQKIKKDGVKEKIFKYDNFKVGFELLSQIDIEKNMIFGNHDILDFKDCISLIKQKEIKNFNIYNKFMSKSFDNTIIFYLDSTVYELFEEGDKEIVNTCYKFIYPKFRTIKNIIDFQLEYVKYKLQERDYTNIIFTFHHPIFTGYISKKGVLKSAYLEKLKDFYVNLYELIKEKKIYHLCADTHFYQHGTIEINIDDQKLIVNQYIVGTGGTILDNIYDEEITFGDVKLIPNESIQNYGFLHVKQVRDHLEFNFINYVDGFKSKYLKYKKKYMDLKNQK